VCVWVQPALSLRAQDVDLSNPNLSVTSPRKVKRKISELRGFNNLIIPNHACVRRAMRRFGLLLPAEHNRGHWMSFERVTMGYKGSVVETQVHHVSNSAACK
jgi:hypothetical protein